MFFLCSPGVRRWRSCSHQLAHHKLHRKLGLLPHDTLLLYCHVQQAILRSSVRQGGSLLLGISLPASFPPVLLPCFPPCATLPQASKQNTIKQTPPTTQTKTCAYMSYRSLRCPTRRAGSPHPPRSQRYWGHCLAKTWCPNIINHS